MLQSYLWLMATVLLYQEGPPGTLTSLSPELRTSLHPKQQQQFGIRVPHPTGRWLGYRQPCSSQVKIARAPGATSRTAVRSVRRQQAGRSVQGFTAQDGTRTRSTCPLPPLSTRSRSAGPGNSHCSQKLFLRAVKMPRVLSAHSLMEEGL